MEIVSPRRRIEETVTISGEQYVTRRTEPAVGKCEICGAHVELDGFTNTCRCGADYNMSGQLLGPREFWGEETGESLADILRIP